MLSISQLNELIQRNAKKCTAVVLVCLYPFIFAGCTNRNNPEEQATTSNISQTNYINQSKNYSTLLSKQQYINRDQYYRLLPVDLFDILFDYYPAIDEYYKDNKIASSSQATELTTIFASEFALQAQSEALSKGNTLNNTELHKLVRESILIAENEISDAMYPEGYTNMTDFKMGTVEQKLGQKLGYETLDVKYKNGTPYKK